MEGMRWRRRRSGLRPLAAELEEPDLLSKPSGIRIRGEDAPGDRRPGESYASIDRSRDSRAGGARFESRVSVCFIDCFYFLALNA